MDNGTREPEFIEPEETNVIMKIPKNSAKITIIAWIIDKDGELQKCSKTLMPDDIRAARQDFLDNVEGGDDYDARYVLTEKGREYLEQLEKERHDEIHCVCD